MTLLFDGPAIPVHGTAAGARTIGDMFRRRAARSASSPAFFEKRSGMFLPVTWDEAYRRAARVARGLLSLAKPGDRVAICGPTQVPWATYDLGAQLATIVSFGIYPQQTVEQVRYLLDHAEARVVIVDGDDEIETVLAAARELPGLAAIVPWTDAAYARFKDRDPRVRPPEVLAGEPLDEAEIDRLASAAAPSDVALFIYTSGTTGPPKGAMISHFNVLSLLEASERQQRLLQSDLSLNFLPMAHAAERILGFYGRVSGGVPGAYAESTATVLDDLRAVRPTVFGSVPRIFEKAHARIHSELEKRPKALQRLFHWGVSVGVARVRKELAGASPPLLDPRFALADALFFKRIRDVFGGRIRMMVTGAAPTALAILEFFWAAGLPIYEAFGMTEATVVTHLNRPGEVKLGTVGRVIAPMEAKIADDGEVLLRGPFVFQGYFKNEAATREALEGGWLHTGDVGRIDADGYLSITDRKKHLIITAGGKNLAPANIEKAIKEEDPLISHVLAHGDKRNFVSAILAPSPIETLEWGVQRGLCTKEVLEARQKELLANPTARTQALADAMAPIVAHPELRERLRAAVRRGNAKLAHVEHVRRFFVIERDFSQEAGELTPTMKVRRKEVEKTYAAKFDLLYDDPSFGLDA
ncbi:MAG: long-chain fatty acid--CoA ligase [Sandaracinaceae bacterium]|nr:long-chain fatty acid--CoA ligase [Sandaracinaceae bacterium]